MMCPGLCFRKAAAGQNLGQSRFCLAILALGLALLSCRPTPQPAPPPAGHSAARLTRVVLEEARTAEESVLSIPLDGRWQLPPATSAGDMARLDVTPDGLYFSAAKSGAAVWCRCPFDAARFNTLRLRMTVQNGAQAALAWSSSLSPGPATDGTAPRTGWPLRPGGPPQTYVVPLNSETCSTWLGAVDHIAIFPSDVATEGTIQHVEFCYLPPEAPQRVTMDHQTMEALPGLEAKRWTLSVPAGAVLECSAGIYDRGQDGVERGKARFRVWVEGGFLGGASPLLDQLVFPDVSPKYRRWLPLRADLGAYAGKPITLRFDVDHAGSPNEDYAYWGNPIVYCPDAPADRVFGSVVLISCDTLRADHLSCYGYHRPTSPWLDRFAREEAALFENAITSETYTLPAHMSMLTGLYPKHHGVTPDRPLPETVQTLAELLQDQGYLAAGFTGHSWWLKSWRGFAQGFDLYDCPDVMLRPIHETCERLEPWLAAHAAPALFLFFHNYDIHRKTEEQGYTLPYTPGDNAYLFFSKPYLDMGLLQAPEVAALSLSELMLAHRQGRITLTEQEHELLAALYDDAIRMVDHALGEFVETLKGLGLYENALIIVTSDHGESLNERGYYNHLHTFEEECRIPLVVKFPGGAFAGARYAPQVQLVDILPTVRGRLGLPPDPRLDGKDLLALLRGDIEPRRFAYSCKENTCAAVRTNEWKFFWQHRNYESVYHLYHLTEDPGEKTNLYSPTLPVAMALHAELSRFYDMLAEGWHAQVMTPKDSLWHATLELASDAPFRHCELIDQYGRTTFPEPADAGRLRLPLAPYPQCHVRLETGAAAPLHVILESVTPFDVVTAGGASQSGPRFERVLAPDENRLSAPPTLPIPERPVIAFWYQAAPAPADRERVPQETRRQLEALGYLEE